MATARLIIRRKPNKDNLYPIVILISNKGTNTELSLRCAIDKKYWDNGRIKRNCPQVDNVRAANTKISSKLNEAWDYIEELEDRRRIDRMTAKQIGEYIKNGGKAHADHDFIEYMEAYIPKIQNISTSEKYKNTLTALHEYTSDPVIFSDINKAWLHRFKEWRMQHVSAATTNIDLRNIRAIFNRAIDVDEIIGQELYPFRKFEFVKADARNLRLSIDKIKAIRDFKTDVEHVALARDFFMLSFYLIGMNNSDIYDISGIEEGRIEYDRKKTDRNYSIKLEPEALEIIERRAGIEKFLIYQERYANNKNLTKQMNKHLKKIGQCETINVPNLMMYHARHSWAGIAARKPIGALKPLIAQALGHGKKTVTDTYFDYDTELVDDLNKRILDLLNE
jgi:hypothetical protein